MGVAELAKEYYLYCDTFTGNLVEYISIEISLLANDDGMVFLDLLSKDQLCVAQLIGRLLCGLGTHKLSHNRIFGLLGGNVGDPLTPITMVLTEGLVPWFHLEERY